MAPIRVVVCEPGCLARVKLVENDLASIRAVIGKGCQSAEPIRRLIPLAGVVILADEDGLPRQLPANRLGLVGTFVVLREQGGKFRGLSEAEARQIAADLG